MTSVSLVHRLALAAALAAVLAYASASRAATPAARAPASHRPATAATLSPDAPFWTGRPTSERFRQLNEQRIARAKAAIARLLAVQGARTVDNTLVPYDEAINQLDMAGAQSGLMENVHPSPGLRATAEKVTQAVAAYGTEISLNRDVYEALKSLDLSGADAETRYYVEKELRDFRLAGVDRDDATRKAIRALRDSIVRVGQDFDRNIREDSPTFKVKPADLEGLPEDWVQAHPRVPDGTVELGIEYPDYVPVLNYATHESLRRQMYVTSANRAYPANLAVLDTIIGMRYRLARLVGFPNYAEYDCADRMVETAGKAREFIARVVQASGDRMTRDYDILLARKRKDVPGATGIDWWDRWYWTNLVKKEQYNFDAQVLRPYFPYDRVKQGVLDVTSTLFGVTYKRVPDAPVWDPSVECWEMYEGGRRVGRFYLDMHPRKDKYNHAAQFDIRTGIEGKQIPEAALVCNLPGDKPGDPGLCEYDDVNTFFHEFGHLLHNLFAGHHRWCGVGGIRTESDFIEAPSQMLEEWMRDPRTLQVFARHYRTGAPVPDSLIQQLRRATEFGDFDPKGIGVRRQMVLADLSLSIYDRPPSEVNSDSINAQLTSRYTPYPYVGGTHFQASFDHLNGYGAAYYTYMWSLVIAKDMFSAFNLDNLLDPAVARRYRDAVLAPGGSKPAAKLVEDFLGRPFSFDAYARWLNLTQ